MRQVAPLREARWIVSPSRFVLPIASLCMVLFLCASSVSCGGTGCIIGVFNPGGTVTVSTNPCSVTISNGTMAVRIGSAPALEGVPAPNLQHVFVSIQGFEALRATTEAENSPEWQELAPALRENPEQVDLLAPATNMCRLAPISRAAVPAGNYQKVRISLVPDPPAEGAAVPATNRCGAAGLQCAITSSGEVRPLTWNGTLEALPPSSAGEFSVRVLPDAESTLTITFHPYAAATVPSTADALRLAPVFTASSMLPCD
jgi:hypothetical protein